MSNKHESLWYFFASVILLTSVINGDSLLPIPEEGGCLTGTHFLFCLQISLLLQPYSTSLLFKEKTMQVYYSSKPLFVYCSFSLIPKILQLPLSYLLYSPCCFTPTSPVSPSFSVNVSYPYSGESLTTRASVGSLSLALSPRCLPLQSGFGLHYFTLRSLDAAE